MASLRTRPLTLYGSREAGASNVPEPRSSSRRQQQAAADEWRQPGSSSQAPSSSSTGGGERRDGGGKSRRRNGAQGGGDGRSGGGGGGGSAVGSNLKKRMSMRYAEPTELGPGGFSAVPDMPPMPSIIPGAPDLPPGTTPYGYDQGMQGAAQGMSRDMSRGYSEDPAQMAYDDDSRDVSDRPNYTYVDDHPTGYVRSKASASSDKETFRNYHDFIRVSKEIGSLENEMLELKELLKEWKAFPHAIDLEETEGNLTDPALRRNSRGNRNSMLDLQQIYRAQIMSLWEGIEGSQKFLPYIPGRHLIAEASSFTELNAATYKPKQGVALFLLDDLLLVAVRKKRQMSARVRLVAERCFSLGEIVVIDLKDGGDLTNAVKIKRGKETFVYRTERGEDKRALLNAFRKVAEELASKRRKESLAEAEARKRESTLMGGPIVAAALAGQTRMPVSASAYAASIKNDDAGGVLAAAVATAASEKKDPGRWINDFADELAVAIALREWGDAVAMVEKGKGVLSTYAPTEAAHQDFSAKLANLTASLVSAISHDLASPTLKKSAVVRNAGYLLRLDKGEKAREIFLAARSELLRRRSRQIKFEGDVSLHIAELALVHFTLVKNTSEWYMSAFKDNGMASGFVKWAAAQIQAYAEIFRRQVYGVADQDPAVIAEAIEISKSSAAQLRDVGLSFGFLLDELLRPDGVSRPIPALTLTLADEPSEAATGRLSAQEIRRQSMFVHPNQ